MRIGRATIPVHWVTVNPGDKSATTMVDSLRLRGRVLAMPSLAEANRIGVSHWPMAYLIGREGTLLRKVPADDGCGVLATTEPGRLAAPRVHVLRRCHEKLYSTASGYANASRCTDPRWTNQGFTSLGETSEGSDACAAPSVHAAAPVRRGADWHPGEHHVGSRVNFCYTRLRAALANTPIEKYRSYMKLRVRL